MKTKYWLYILIVGMCGIFAQCKKTKTTAQTKSYKIYNKTLDEIKTEIRGEWIMHQICGCNSFSCSCNPTSDTYMTFSANDTLKWVYFGNLHRYGKMSVTRVTASSMNITGVDSVYVFYIPNDFYAFSMREIRNDTLIISGGGQLIEYYLTRKP